jgi:hypothetical protein
MSISIHNRFDIEVRDSLTNKLKKTAKAENIVLNQMYNRICNFSTFFVNIHFGTGTGTMDPTRTTLFSHLGTKAAVDEEKILSKPLAKWTRRITLDPAEYVGQTLTEVGIAYGSTSSYLVTHALITDSEGSPINIVKGSTDILIIYATVYITLQDTDSITFSAFDINDSETSVVNANRLLRALTGTSISTTIIADASMTPSESPRMNTLSSLAPTVTVDVAAKTRSYSVRFGVDNANNGSQIGSFYLDGICKYTPTISTVLTDEPLGYGDGITTIFPIFPSIVNPVVKIDGVPDPNAVFVVNNNHRSGRIPPMEHVIELLPGAARPVLSSPLYNFPLAMNTNGIITFKVDGNFKNKILNTQYSGGGGTLYLERSSDGVNWTTVYQLVCTSTSQLDSRLIEWDDLYYRLRKSYEAANVVMWIPYDGPLSTVEFQVAPPQDAVLTIDGTVPYYPKSVNYVVDASITLEFGEGM